MVVATQLEKVVRKSERRCGGKDVLDGLQSFPVYRIERDQQIGEFLLPEHDGRAAAGFL